MYKNEVFGGGGGGGGGDSVLAAVSVKHSPERNDVMYLKGVIAI